MKTNKEIREIAKRIFNDNYMNGFSKKDLIHEHTQYLKIDYKNTPLECKHLKGKTQDAFKAISENLECAEIYCLECNSFIGYVLRQIKKIPNQKPKKSLLLFANNPNCYSEYKPK
jgi:hypothetical protein